MSYLGQVVRVKTTDGRAIYGTLKAYTPKLDVILSNVLEQQPGNAHVREVGHIVIPGPTLEQISLQHL